MPTQIETAATHRVIDAVWRIESAKIIAGLTRIVRDVGLAEELAQDALVAALERWPESGVPDNPGAWLMATAKHRAMDHFRRNKLLERKHEELGRELESQQESAVANFDAAFDTVNDADFGDDLLRLVFISCHPVLATEARVALTLRLLGGLTTQEIARAFLVPEPTVAQRIVRAKRTLAEARVPFEVPRGPDLAARLSSVLEVIYLVFNEGYSATAGEDWMRPALCEDALRLGRILAGLAPNEPEVHGLVALMEIQASRSRARVRPSNRSCSSIRIAPAGIISSYATVLPRSSARNRSVARWAPTRCKPLSRPATPARTSRPKPTGPASPPSTKPWPSSRPLLSSNSIAPSPSPWLSARKPGSNSSTISFPNRRSSPTTSCPPSAPTSSKNWAASTKP